MTVTPLYNFFPFEAWGPELNDVLRQIDDSLRYLLENSAVGGTLPAIALDDLSDVNAGLPADNDYLRWDQATSRWINEAVAPGPVNVLDDLTDVTISGVEAEQRLKYNGAQWVNVGPVDLTFSYTGDQLTGVDGAGINIDFTYNGDGSLNTIDNQTKILTAGYSSGRLATLTVSNS